MLTDLDKAVHGSGLTIIELPGWRTRRSGGDLRPQGVLCHHTGGASNDRGYVEWMAYEGRSDLDPPLCNLALDRQGRVYVCAAGNANHGGKARATGPMPASRPIPACTVKSVSLSGNASSTSLPAAASASCC